MKEKKDGVTDVNGVTTYSTVTGSTDGNIAGTDPYITYTYYYYKIEDYLNTNLGINTAPAGLLNVGKTYWLASRFVGDYSGRAACALICADSTGAVGNISMFYSDGQGLYADCPVRPVVSLSSNATLTKDIANSTDEVTYWNIEYEL